MNSSSQAQKGFKTFIFTLVISLVVFSAIYFIINSGNSSESDKNASVQSANNSGLENVAGTSKADSEVTETSTLGMSTDVESVDKNDTPTDSELVLNSEAQSEPVVTNAKTPFTDLANQKLTTTTRGVLAGTDTSPTTTTTTTTTTATTTSESTVPDTGVSGPTIGLILSSIILGAGAFILFIGPRKMALSSFEKKVIKGLH